MRKGLRKNNLDNCAVILRERAPKRSFGRRPKNPLGVPEILQSTTNADPAAQGARSVPAPSG